MRSLSFYGPHLYPSARTHDLPKKPAEPNDPSSGLFLVTFELQETSPLLSDFYH